MGGIVSSLGLGGGDDTGGAGTKFVAGTTPTLNPVTQQQINNSTDLANKALSYQQTFADALNAQNGIQNQSNVYGQLQQIASGQGANPAQAMLNQSTGQNVANQAALMAGQRGASANPALIARQAAQQGAAAQQNAIGQAATLQANQSLGALGQAGNIAGQQVSNLGNANQQFVQNAIGEQGQILNAANQNNNTNVALKSNQNSVNGGLANTVAQGQQNLAGNVFGGIGSAVSSLFASGGEVVGHDRGEMASAKPIHNPKMPKSNVGKFHMQGGMPMQVTAQQQPMFAKGGKVPAMVSPGEIYLKPDQAKQVAKGKQDPRAGEQIQGKAAVKGDSLKNDVVHKNLDEGGVVIPRSIALSGDGGKMAKFVAASLAKNGHMPKKR